MALSLMNLPQICFSNRRTNTNNHRTTKTTHISCASASTQFTASQVEQRRSANYQPTIWSYKFLQSLEINDLDEVKKIKAMKLKEEVRRVLVDENQKWLAKLELIDDIERLGLGYHFEKDIQRALDRFVSLGGFSLMEDSSLHAIALSFRLLRQHGYDVSQDVFNHLRNSEGDIEVKCLETDYKGILSMYEASHLACEGEDILDKARVWSTLLLQDIQRSKGQKVAARALELPLHRRIPLLEARLYIDEYNKREDTKRADLALLSMLNFNTMQSVLQSDLKHMSRWWNNLGLASKLSFSRDRLMECFFWTVGMAFEPRFSSCRKGLTQVTSFVTIIDDVYDVYGTLEELELFTEAVERWNMNCVKDLPHYMKLCFLAFYNTINDMAFDILKEHGEDAIPYLTSAWADLFKAFLKEAKWAKNKRMPSFDEYLENAWRSVSGTVILVHAYFLMGQTMTSASKLDDCFVNNYHDLLRWPSIIFRLCNDLGTSSAELERGETINTITCYMNENGVSEDIAREQLHKLIDEAWKKMNKLIAEIDDNKSNSPFSKSFLQIAINMARIAYCTYQHGDSHGAPDANSKKRVLSLIIEPIPIPDF